MIALEQLGSDLIPHYGRGRILIVRLNPRVYCLKLRGRQRSRIRAFSGNAVPDVLRELNPLGDREAEEVGSRLAHGSNIRRSFVGA